MMPRTFKPFGALPRQVVRRLIRLYYPAIEVANCERIPATGPVLFVANHANSLIDPVIIGIAARRPVHFLAKAPLFDTPVLGPAMKALGMLPAYRGVDDIRQVAKNTESLAAAAECLAQREAVGIFPEGKSHDELKVDQVKSGAARIASQAVQKGAEGVKIVPLGLNYERKEQFRSAIWVQVGEPIPVDKFIKPGEAEDKRGLRALTQEIDHRLKAVVIHLAEASWEPFLHELGILAPGASAESIDPLAVLRQRKRLANAINHFMEHDRERALRLAVEIRRHREALAEAGLEIRSAVVRFHNLALFWRLVKQTVGLGFGMVPTLLGLLHHLVPFAVVRLAAPRFEAKGRTTKALMRLAFGLPVYALWYAAVWWAAARYFRPGVAWVWTLAMPFAGLFALACCRRVRDLARDWWCQMRAVFQRSRIASLRRQQAELAGKLAALEADFARTQPPEAPVARASVWRRWRRVVLGGATVVIAAWLATAWWRVRERPPSLPELQQGGPALARFNNAVLTSLLNEEEAVLAGVLQSARQLEQRAGEVKADFDAGKRSFYRQADDDTIRQLLFSYLSCRTELLRLIWQFQDYAQVKDGRLRQRSFLVALTAGAVLHDASTKFVLLFEGAPNAIRKLNEPEPRWGIPPGLYDAVRHNLAQREHHRLLEAALKDYRQSRPAMQRLGLVQSEPYATFHIAIEQSARRIASPSIAEESTAVAVAREAGRLGKQAVYWGQSLVSTWVGDTRVRQPRAGQPLIQPEQLEQVRRRLLPGDVLLERQNWFLSRAFMPGYWAHAALYVGTRQDLQQLGLHSDPRVAPHWEAFIRRDEQGHEHVIIEAVPRGVRMSTLEHVLGIADSAAALRPKLTADQRREAVAQAFSHLNKPYDFEFDFFSTDKLVCTELVYRCYDGPLQFELVNVMGRLTLPPTELARKHALDRAQGRPQFDLVAFLDGVESMGRARFSDESTFADTINRPSLTWLQK